MGESLRDVLDELLPAQAVDDLTVLMPVERPCVCAATLKRYAAGKKVDRVVLKHAYFGNGVSVEVFLASLREKREAEIDALTAGFIKYGECPGRRLDGA